MTENLIFSISGTVPTFWILGNCLDEIPKLPDGCVDMIFADPPYFLSNDGVTCKDGKLVSVNKGEWDKSDGFDADVAFTEKWLSLCLRVLKDTGSIWVSGTHHNIHVVGYIMQKLGMYIINDVVWYKRNASPNLCCKSFTHSHETIIWAKKSRESSNHFNYELIKKWNDPQDTLKSKDKQMRSVWSSARLPDDERFGDIKHPTQKPLWLLIRIIAASTQIGDLILDPFSGSGTTAIAANLLKRRVISIEKNKEYYDYAKARYEQPKTRTFYYPMKQLDDFLKNH